MDEHEKYLSLGGNQHYLRFFIPLLSSSTGYHNDTIEIRCARLSLVTWYGYIVAIAVSTGIA
jgi:hypothetical protein